MSEDKNNMKVPKDYFEQKRIALLQFAGGDEDMLELAQDAPLLFEIGKREGFLLPEHYFEHLDIRKVLHKEEDAFKLPAVRRWMYAAVAACALCIFGYFGMTKDETLNSSVADSFIELESEEDIEEAYTFLLEELEGFTNEELLYEDAYADFLLEEDNITDSELETIINELSDEFQIEDFEDLF